MSQHLDDVQRYNEVSKDLQFQMLFPSLDSTVKTVERNKVWCLTESILLLHKAQNVNACFYFVLFFQVDSWVSNLNVSS